MNQQEMIKEILAYEQELKYNYKENSDAFGFSDDSTQRAVTKWLVMDELLTRLNLQK